MTTTPTPASQPSPAPDEMRVDKTNPERTRLCATCEHEAAPDNVYPCSCCWNPLGDTYRRRVVPIASDELLAPARSDKDAEGSTGEIPRPHIKRMNEQALGHPDYPPRILLEQLNNGDRWDATCNKTTHLYIGTRGPHEVLQRVLSDLGVSPVGVSPCGVAESAPSGEGPDLYKLDAYARQSLTGDWHATEAMIAMLSEEVVIELVALARRATAGTTAAPRYGSVNVVGDLVRNLLTLDQAAPIYAAFHLDIDGRRRCRTRPIATSWERVVDGKWVESSRIDVPYSVIVWAKPDERATAGNAAPDESRYYMDHGVLHDRESGHLWTQDQYDEHGREMYYSGVEEQMGGVAMHWAVKRATDTIGHLLASNTATAAPDGYISAEGRERVLRARADRATAAPGDLPRLLRHALLNPGYIGPHEEGGWVKFEDVQALLASNAGAAPLETYRLLDRGDIIEKDDEWLREDGVTWIKGTPVFIGMEYLRNVMLPARRRIAPSNPPVGAKENKNA